jgi:sigma-E factor negative regulatory protein RseA
MTEQIREQISAWLDGELREDETGLLVRRLERDPALRGALGRFVLAGEVLRAPGGQLASPGFAARVSAAIGAGPGNELPVALREKPAGRWSRPLLGAAVAAASAVVAVLVLRPDAGERNLAAQTATAVQPVALAAPLGQRSSPTPARNQRLAGYLVAHSQYASPLSRRSVWTGVLAADPGITRVAYDLAEAP